ncbi:hypothetical protein [Hoylesella timonensis]|nr:hypothetical protein [Hoylesella timonensis]
MAYKLTKEGLGNDLLFSILQALETLVNLPNDDASAIKISL